MALREKSFGINEEGRKAGKKRPTAPPALRVGQLGRERILVPEEESGKSRWGGELDEFQVKNEK